MKNSILFGTTDFLSVQRCFGNLQHPCCKLPCEFHKNKFLWNIVSDLSARHPWRYWAETRVQKLTRMSIQQRHGCRWFHAETSFLFYKKLAVTNVQGYTFQNCHGWQWFHAAAMFRLCPKLASKNWQGCQFSSDTDVAGSMQKRVFCSTKNS